MAYRDRLGDPRVGELRRLIDSEAAERDAALQNRFAQDEATERVDRLGSELESPGLLGRLFGRGDVDKKREELAVATARLDELVAQERAIGARLDAIASARTELAAIEAAAGVALRAADDPAGAEYRALDAAIASEAGKLAAFERGLRAIEQADTAIAAVLSAEHDRRVAQNQGGLVGLLEELGDDGDRAVRERIREAIVHAQAMLRALVATYETIPDAPAFPATTVEAYVATAIPPKAERSILVQQADMMARVLSSLLSSVGEARDRVRARHDTLVTQQRELTASYLG